MLYLKKWFNDQHAIQKGVHILTNNQGLINNYLHYHSKQILICSPQTNHDILLNLVHNCSLFNPDTCGMWLNINTFLDSHSDMQFYKTDFLSIDYVLLTLKINITGTW